MVAEPGTLREPGTFVGVAEPGTLREPGTDILVYIILLSLIHMIYKACIVARTIAVVDIYDGYARCTGV